MKKRMAQCIALVFSILLLTACSSGGGPVNCEDSIGYDLQNGDIILASQADVNSWYFKPLNRVNGSMFIGYCQDRGSRNITNVDALRLIEEIDGDLLIRENTSLRSLEGLKGLKKVKGDLLLYENPNLISLTGLENLEEIGGTLHLLLNTGLQNLDGLKNLKSVGGIRLWFNDRLIHLDGLQNLETLSGYIDISYCDELIGLQGLKTAEKRTIKKLSIEYNNKLTSLEGLEGIIEIEATNSQDGDIMIGWNDSLLEIDALSSISKVGKHIEIRGNKKLQNIEGLVGISRSNGYLGIIENPNLASLEGLNGLTYVKGSLEIFDNDTLKNLDALYSMQETWRLRIWKNDRLTDLCGITPLVINGGISPGGDETGPYYLVEENAYNPTREDIENGDCRQ